MEAIIFTGIQATGKSTFYTERFLNSHVRISMDLLNTRNKEQVFLDICFAVHQAFVVDNTNPMRSERSRYIQQAKLHQYRVIGYYFRSDQKEVLERNKKRTGKERIPEAGIRGAYNRLELPSYDEGFDELYYVKLGDNKFIVNDWKKG
jgi:predicted kinase